MEKVFITDKQGNKVLPKTHVSAVYDDEGNDLGSHLGAFEDEVRGLVDTPHQEYVTVATYASLPAQGSKDTIYRVSNYNGSTSQVDTTSYSEYAWDGSQYIFLCVKSQIDDVFDITVYNNNTKYADLSAALGVDGANIPATLRRGGMSVKFVQSSDNKYMQFMYIGTAITGTPNPFLDTDNWEEYENSVKTQNEIGDSDLDISDENGNVLVKFSGGHIKTKYFDSKESQKVNNNCLISEGSFAFWDKYLIPEGTVAFWDFCRDEDYLVDIVSGHALTPVNVTKDAIKGVYFNGISAYLKIENAEVGNLDVSKYGEQVTVMALVNPSALNNSYIAGMWTENDNNPHREYGLFIDLPIYGGPRKVIGHVSRTGGASPNLPYSRDYSASGRSVIIGRESFIGMTYDGHVAKSFLDGLTDSYINYTEPAPPLGQSLTYNKNPYIFNLGLNKESEADFNVGANLLTNGMSNFYKGYISKLIVVARALSEKEMANMAYFYCKNTAFATFPNIESSNETIEAYQGGFKTRTSIGGVITDNLSSGNSIKEVKSTTESSLYISPSAETTALAYIESVYLYLSQISSFSFMVKSNGGNIEGVRLCIKVGDNWYASANIVPTLSYTESSIQVDFSANMWYAFDFTNLSVRNMITDEISNTRINAIGIFFDSVSSGATVNIANIKINI